MQKRDLIVLATYWNEIDWINASLAQIDLIRPKEVIICDGCFDHRRKNFSTDGTSEIIKNFAKERDNVKVVPAIRMSKWRGVLKYLRGFGGHQRQPLPSLGRLATTAKALTLNTYRVNQALTFNYMCAISETWSSTKWVMTIDADQFYTDDFIDNLDQKLDRDDIGIISGKEKTFFDTFNYYTDQYESRDYNNLPHRIREDTYIMPTRGIIRDQRFRLSQPLRSLLYEANEKKVFSGSYFHYKIRSPERSKLTYELGDRAAPCKNYQAKRFVENHPRCVTDHRNDKEH